jgi:hypothetical protein
MEVHSGAAAYAASKLRSSSFTQVSFWPTVAVQSTGGATVQVKRMLSGLDRDG